jgi:hypothetical protein
MQHKGASPAGQIGAKAAALVIAAPRTAWLTKEATKRMACSHPRARASLRLRPEDGGNTMTDLVPAT